MVSHCRNYFLFKWSILVLILSTLFYFLFPLLRKKIILYILLTSIIISMVLIFLDMNCKPVGPPWIFPHEGDFFSLHLCLQFPIMRVLEFCVGIYAGRIFINFESNLDLLHNKIYSILEIFSILLILFFAVTGESIRSIGEKAGFSHFAIFYNQCGGMIFFAFMILVFACQRGILSKLLMNSFFISLGSISFCTYMIHVPIFSFMIKIGIMNLPQYLAATITILVIYKFIFFI